MRDATALAAHLVSPPRCIQFAQLPTPVLRAPWLDTDAAQVWIKRDDVSCEIYGGGKVRKLEWALANPPFDGSDAVFSTGGIGSNHLVALALFLARLDRRLHALVFDQPYTDHVRDNLATVASLGAEFWYVRRRWQLPLMWARHAITRPGSRAMTPGASTPLSCFGFVEAGLELAGQIEAGVLPKPATVFITGGTGGAAAGLAIGLAVAGVATHLQVVSAVEPTLFNRWFLGAKLRGVYRALRDHGLQGPASVGARLADAGVTWAIDHAFVGDSYGAPTEAGRHVQALAEEHDLHFDPTYTAKCAAALRASPRSGPAVFWHTHAATDLRPHIDPDWQQRLPDRLRSRIAVLQRDR
jgi:D-cysteine desulfhydrase